MKLTEKLIEDKTEARAKLLELEEFINSDAYSALGNLEKHYWVSRYKTLNDYITITNSHIEFLYACKESAAV